MDDVIAHNDFWLRTMLTDSVCGLRKNVARRFKRSLVILPFLVCLVLSPSSLVYAQNPKKLNILFVFSWHKNMPWQVEIERGVALRYRDLPHKPNLFYEYMDAGRFKSHTQINIFKNYLTQKYAAYDMDCVIFESFYANRLFISNPGLFKNAKIFLLNPGPFQDGVLSDTSTAIPVNADYDTAAQTFLAVSRGKTIYLVAGATADSQKRVQIFSERLHKFDGTRKIVPLIGLPMNQLIEKVANLEPDSIIYYLLVFQDGAGVRYIPYDAAVEISRHASVPVYSLWTSLLGSGIVGGYLLSGEMVGEEAASIVMGPDFDETVDVRQIAPKFHGFFYDWRQLKRWHIDERGLPAGSRILYKEQAFYAHYYKELVAGALIAVILISFFWNSRLRKEIKARLKVEEHLQASEDRFRSLSDAAFEGILISDGGKIVDANHMATIMFGYSATELKGMMAFDLVTQAYRDDVQKKLLAGYEKPYETLGLKKGGETFATEVHAKMYTFKRKRVRVTAVRDLTEKKQAEEALLKSKRMQGVLEMAGAVCHEMSQPLMAISGYAELLSLNLSEDHPLFEKTSKIKEQIARMGKITDRLMRLTKYETKEYLRDKIIDIEKSSERS